MKFRRLCLLLLMAAMCCGNAFSQVRGEWAGVLDVMGNKLNIVFHFDESDCTLDSPDQGAKGIPAELLYNANDSVSVSVKVLGAAYNGRLAEGMLKGKFTQRGMSFPLDLKPGGVERKRPQTPQPPFPYATEELTFSNPADGAVLAGTLTVPDGYDKSLLVVLVSGSGQQNRDEELFDHKPFAVIADFLARHGIASFRYDDRGVGASNGLRSDLTTADFRDDALAAVNMLREKGVADHIGILGHSEGGLIAFMIAGEQPEALDFVISLAGTAVKGEEVLVSQVMELYRQMGQPISEDQARTSVAAEKSVPWMAFFLEYDPSEAISRIVCPVFAANGTKDVQVLAALNIPALRNMLKQKPTDKIEIYEGLNHLFQHADTGMTTEYASIEETISPQLLADIVAWLNNLK